MVEHGHRNNKYPSASTELLVGQSQPHPELPGSLNFCPLCLIFEEKFQRGEEISSWIDNENRIKEDSDFPGVSLTLIWDRNFSG